jgi:hypothetical protein
MSSALAEMYRAVKKVVEDLGYSAEINWQHRVNFQEFSETDFLREYAWVVFNSGFRESVVRKKFDYLSLCFLDWESASVIYDRRDMCVEAAMRALGNRQKLRAVITTSEKILERGFFGIRSEIYADPLEYLQEFPFIGPATSCHLAKNLGFDVAKPDRHLVRLSNAIGCRDVNDLCQTISNEVGESISIVDIVLWRYSTLRDVPKITEILTLA